MKRRVYLEGEIADRFGSEFTADVTSIRDVFRLMEANHPELRSYLVNCHEKGVGFAIEVARKEIEKEEDLLLPLEEGDISIFSVPAGSKSGGAKILAAIAVIGLMFIPGGAAFIGAYGAGNLSIAAYAAGAASLGISAGIAGTVMLAAGSIALNLALTGIQQIMAPDPSVDESAPQSYMFNGAEQNIIEGDPVPILYGELRVPGRPIAFSVVNNSRVFSAYGFNGLLESGSSVIAPGREGLYTTEEP